MSAWNISAFLNCVNVAKLSPLIYSTLVPTSLAGCAAGWHACKRAPAMRNHDSFSAIPRGAIHPAHSAFRPA